MKQAIRRPKALRGEVSPPGDKSLTHRALLFNAIASGTAKVTNYSRGADCLSTMACLRAMGVRIEENRATLTIHGSSGEGLAEPVDVLNAGNSGTTIRLISGLLASRPYLSVITGDSSLRSRPMGRLAEPLRLMGAQIWGRRGDTLAPLAIKGGHLKGINYRLPVASAQIKSAVLIAGLFASSETTVEEPMLSRDHTERMFAAMGVKLQQRGCATTITPGPLSSVDVRVPGDISSAAYWLLAGVLHPNAQVRVTGVGVNPTRTGILDVLTQMGAQVSVENRQESGGEPVADIVASSSTLHGVEVSGPLIPRTIDELPLVALAGCFASGTTVIKDASELRVKESDRISATVQELSKLGAKIEELPDGMVIHGGHKLTGAECVSHGDHRLAMTLAVAGLAIQGETVIDNAEAVEISYPEVWNDLEKLRR